MNNKVVRYGVIGFIVLLIIVGLVSCFNFGSQVASLEYNDIELVQLEGPKQGQEIAIVDTTLGQFKIMLFREYAPKTVENFVNLSKEGYYDGKYVHGVQKGLFFMAGTSSADGVIVKDPDKEDKYKKLEDKENNDEYKAAKKLYDTEMTKRDNEVNKNLWPLKGSIISLGPDMKDSGIYFTGINEKEITKKEKKSINKQEKLNKDLANAFYEKGGIIDFSQKFTVFAQTYEGLDVFEKICNVDTKTKSLTPKEEIKIKSIKIEKFSK